MSIHRSFRSTSSAAFIFRRTVDPAKGIALALISNALFAVVGVIVRELSQSIDIFPDLAISPTGLWPY